MTDKDIIKALMCCIIHEDCTGCPLQEDNTQYCLKATCKNALDLINRQQEELESNRLSLGLMNKRKYYRKFVDEVFRKQKGKELSTPDFDYIYELYFNQQAEIENYSHNVRGLTKSIRKYQKLYDEMQSENKRLKVNNKAIMQTMADVHTEAIKEFAEKLKDIYIKDKRYDRPNAHTLIDWLFANIDNLVKEMVGENK